MALETTIRVRWATALLGALALSAIGCGGSGNSNGPGAETVGGNAADAGQPGVDAAGSNEGGEVAGGRGGSAAVGGGAGTTSSTAGTGGDIPGSAGGDPATPVGGAGGAEAVVEDCGVLVDDSLTIATTRVMDGIKGGAYDVSLVPLGGSREGYTFDVVKGTLPGGLTLDTTGRLHGVIGSEGPFTFGVRLRDSAQHETIEDFSMNVSLPAIPPRWTVTEDTSLARLNLTDSLHPDAPKITLQGGHGIFKWALSPDASMLVYKTDITKAGKQTGEQIYLVRLTGDKPTAELFLTESEYTYFSWSPDSKLLSLASLSGLRCALVGPETIQVVDVDASPQEDADLPIWLTNITLGYRVTGYSGLRYSTVRNGVFGVSQGLPDFASIKYQTLVTVGEQIAYRTFKSDTWWHDLDTNASQELGVGAQASQGLRLVARNAADGHAFQVVTLADAQPLLSWPQTKPSFFVWGGDRALIASSDRVDIWRRSGAGSSNRASVCVDGLRARDDSYATRFSPDGTWVFYTRSLGKFRYALDAVGIRDGQMLPPVDALDSTGEHHVYLAPNGLNEPFLYEISPDSRWLVARTTPDANPQGTQVQLMRLTTDGALTPHAVTAGGGQDPTTFHWSADSQLVVTTADKKSYVINPSDLESAPQ